VTSKYQHLVLTKNVKQGDLRLYINGNTQFSSLDEVRYHELLVHPAMNLAKKIDHILILGGGDGLALREVLKFKQVKKVTLVDLDPQMVKLASSNPYLRQLNQNAFADARVQSLSSNALSDSDKTSIYLQTKATKSAIEWVAQVDVFHLDADQFIRQLYQNNLNQPESSQQNLSHTWDVVIIDFPDPSSIELAKLYSKEFYYKLKKILSRDALIAVQSTSPYHAKDAFIAISETIKSADFDVLPYHQNIPSFGDWGFNLAWSNRHLSKEIRNKINNLESLNSKTNFLTAGLLRASLVFGKNELTTDNKCINTLMQPCLLNLYQNYSWLGE
jgi:spermidine synthase